jgi:transcription initiation factor TFIID subunit 7
VIISEALESSEPTSTSTSSSSSSTPSEEESDVLDVDDTPTRSAVMSPGERPKLKLSFPKNKAPGQETVISPAPQSALRTPSIKLHLKPSVAASPANPTSSAPAARPKKKKPAANGATPRSSAKKRKQPDADGSEDELARKPAQVRKLTLTTKPPTAQSPVTPTLKLKYRGRVPKRPLGLGYDSELDECEPDPTILESFILRLPPGPDCEYLRDAIEHSTIGVARSQGGADVQMKFFDRLGRRGVLIIRGQRWATTLVDLPCIIEGLKSWDKKGWVKSVDICQMLLALGKVQKEEQAKDFPLPQDVNPQTWQYAHGLTPPMRWVRKRRFARTNRTSVNAIEAVERRVNQLLAEDELAVHTKFELLDHDPATRNSSRYSSTESDEGRGEGYDEDADADGEEVDGEYFGGQFGIASNVVVDTPTIVESQTPHEEEDADDDFILSGLMEAQDKPVVEASLQPIEIGLTAPEGDSSIAITSTSPSAADTAAPTPAAVETSGADDDSEDSDADEDESMDDEDREATAQKQKALDEIQELKEELRKQTIVLKTQTNSILRRKVAARIEQIEGDLETARKTAGVDGDAEDGAEDG